ncbi:MAG: hypothetical protein ACF8Q5_03530 [Phycisphaerales bacterium JB040]
MVGNILSWVKSNLLIVIFTVVTILLIPGAYVGSSMWNKKIKAAAEDEYNSTKRELDSAERVTYTLPAVFEGEETITQTRAPNEAVTEFYASKREARTNQVREVVSSAVERNRGEHDVMLPELLPNQPDKRRRDRLTQDFASMLRGTENSPSAYKRLLDRINAGVPVEADDVAAIVGDYETQERERLMAEGVTDPSPEQLAELRKRLILRRLGAVAQQAEDLSVYASEDAILAPAEDPAFSSMPTAGLQDVPGQDLFRWQWDYWVIEDVLGAIARANSDATGATGVPDSVVKKINRILVQRPDFSGAGGEQAEEEDDFGGGFGASRGGAGATGPWKSTHTGRLGSPPEGMDVRMVRLDVVAAPARLPRLFEALGEQNFMTVTSVKISDIDAWEDLKKGYYYGPEHVARVTLDIETVWLREWTKEFMPDELREKLGIPREDESTDEDDPFGTEG